MKEQDHRITIALIPHYIIHSLLSKWITSTTSFSCSIREILPAIKLTEVREAIKV